MGAGQRADELLQLIIEEASGFDDLGRRIIANKIIGVLHGWLPEEKKVATAEILEPMSTAEVDAFERERMEFGKHQGDYIWEIDKSYLAWLADSQRILYRKITRYLNNPNVKREWEEDD